MICRCVYDRKRINRRVWRWRRKIRVESWQLMENNGKRAKLCLNANWNREESYFTIFSFARLVNFISFLNRSMKARVIMARFCALLTCTARLECWNEMNGHIVHYFPFNNSWRNWNVITALVCLMRWLGSLVYSK